MQVHQVLSPTAACPNLQQEGTWTWQKPHHAPNRCQSGYLGRAESQRALGCSSEQCLQSFGTFQQADCCCVTGLKLCSQSPSGMRFLWKNQHSLHKRFYSRWLHKLILLSSTWICWNVHWVNWPTSRRQAAGSILGFGIQTCTATWGKDTEQSCLVKQNSSVYQNSVFLNVSAMDGSPN